MMMKKLCFLVFVLIVGIANSQTIEQLFTEGNSLYKEGRYEEAIIRYDSIIAQQKVSSELYYNLGNCYYKLNKVAPAIYHYEKAVQLDPLNEDAVNNLIFAKRLTLDRIEELPKTVFQKFNENYLQKLTYNEWAVVCVVLSFLATLLFLLFYFSFTPNKKRFYFVSSMVAFILLFSSIIITYNQYKFSQSNTYAIIYLEKVTVKNAPTFNSNEVFTLHEGTKVKVLDSVDDWKKIKLADGKIGWVEINSLKVL